MTGVKSTGVDVCLVSPGLPSSNPRLVKEAGALSAAGYRVHCVVGDYATPLRDHDAEIIAATGATMERVPLGSRSWYRWRRLLQRGCHGIARFSSSELILARACSTESLRLAAAAGRIRAGLYVGHTLGALPAVVLAARRHGTAAGFDAEDFHSEETRDESLNELFRRVERRFIPECRHFTCASLIFAEKYEAMLGMRPVTILNAFDRPDDLDWKRGIWDGTRPLSLYWFSQTVGPGRGLEQAVAAMGQCRADVQLAVRGICSPAYRAELEQLAMRFGLKREIRFLPPAPPETMIACAAEHDVGLSLELKQPRNRDWCLTNKLFTYLAAGRPQVVSDTTAQRRMAGEIGASARVIDLADTSAFAAAIDAFAASPMSYRAAADAADSAYRERFSWQRESQRLVECVSAVLPRPPRSSGTLQEAVSC
jgi:glycosyltransferase involved in cell wall biosynthesis